jgi:hypothetical protein
MDPFGEFPGTFAVSNRIHLFQTVHVQMHTGKIANRRVIFNQQYAVLLGHNVLLKISDKKKTIY